VKLSVRAIILSVHTIILSIFARELSVYAIERFSEDRTLSTFQERSGITGQKRRKEVKLI
jgi:hypothetical protein